MTARAANNGLGKSDCNAACAANQHPGACQEEQIMNNSEWLDVTPAAPCQICGKDSWCTRLLDGRWGICRREAAGGLAKIDCNGVPYYIHRIDAYGRSGCGAPVQIGRALAQRLPALGVACESNTIPPAERADDATLSAVYNALLNDLRLDPRHFDDLARRGLSPAEIDWRQYRTLPPNGAPWIRNEVAGRLADRFGDDVLAKVPGFKRGTAATGRGYWTITGKAGLLIPVRNVKAEIVALKIRPDEPGDGGKYRALSSKHHGGPGPGQPAHVPLRPIDAAPCEGRTVAVVEGVLKADIVAALDPAQVPCIGIDGCGSWRSALPILRDLGAHRVNYYIDPDATDPNHPQVGSALKAFWQALKREGYEPAIALDTGRAA